MTRAHDPSSSSQVCALEACESPVGPLILGATAQAVCLIEFCDEKLLATRLAALRERNAALLRDASPLIDRLRAQFIEYFSGERSRFDVPLTYEGTVFQRQVWEMLLRIPFGQTWSYLDLATRIGDPLATRAVGAANGRNPLAIVIPCHRVVNANGGLGGYGGGAWRKRILLDLELGQRRLSL